MNTQLFFADAEDLISEHFDGRFPGLLNMATDFLLRYRATQGFTPDEELVEAAANEGFGEEEIAAALLLESGEFEVPENPWGVETGWK